MTEIVLAQTLGNLLQQRGWTVATAESCTGGLLAGAITAIAGSSAWFEHGFVTYANAAKTRWLGVAPETLACHGAVSAPVITAMATGALAFADMAIATSGIAGPDGGSPAKPVGTVWFAWAVSGRCESECRVFSGDRHQVRAAAVAYALQRAIDFLKTSV